MPALIGNLIGWTELLRLGWADDLTYWNPAGKWISYMLDAMLDAAEIAEECVSVSGGAFSNSTGVPDIFS